MKVVLFCGGLGTRLRTHSDTIPKPLASVGARPIIWHLMRYYAHYGHKDFILALGYQGQMIREYFLEYNECLSNDFTLSEGGKKIELYSSDVHDWRITFVETGLHSNIGQRLLRVRRYLGDDEIFLANYSDALSNVPIDTMVAEFERNPWVASFAAVHTSQSYHVVESNDEGYVRRFGPMHGDGIAINGGYFVLGADIFDYLHEGEELVAEPFQRLIREDKLGAHQHNGFWQAMDTLKDKIAFDRMEARGDCPWMLWKESENNGAPPDGGADR